jgi:PAS domain S-box-containing protein
VRTLKDLLSHLRKGPRAEQYETEWQTQTGETRLLSWSIQALLSAQGEVDAVFATGVDVTERKQAEAQLELERRFLQGLIDSIPDFIFYKDRQGVYQGCNTSLAKFKNFTKTEIVGHTDSQIYGLELAQDFSDSDRRVILQGETITFENWTEDQGGDQVLVETRKTPYYGLDGEILGIIGIGRDITRHRKVENALRETNQQMENLISSLSSSLIVLDEKYRILRWTHSAQTLLGISAGEAGGKHIGKVAVAWDWGKVSESIEKCRREICPVYPDPISFIRRDGKEGYLGVNISPVCDPHRNVLGFILLCNDITERKIRENRLAQVSRMESIGRLAAGIAHEINTPIQYVNDNVNFLKSSTHSLLGLLDQYEHFTSLLKAGQVDAGNIAQMEAAIEEADLHFLEQEIPLSIEQASAGLARVAEIVRAMKEFSHPGARDKTHHDLNQALQNALAVARNEWKYVAEIEADYGPDIPKVLCYPGEINQVLLNIIVNAAQAIGSVIKEGESKGVIRITTTRSADWVEIRISDTGPGIPKEVQPRIFEPFFTTKEVGKGTGQGLAIAYDVVERKHGGTLAFESQVGKGTTFIIRLPIELQETIEGRDGR